MKRVSALFFLTLFASCLLSVTIPGGPVSGIWSLANSPYEIIGNITVENGQTLQIEPGVIVRFTDHFSLMCNGRIYAAGTEQDSILFTASNPAIGWHGIRYVSPSLTNEASVFSHCTFEYGRALEGASIDKYGGAFYIEDYSAIGIHNCCFRYNQAVWGGAIQMENASIIIENSIFHDNYSQYSGAAIRCFEGANGYFRNNLIENNTSGIGGAGFYSYLSTPTFINNIFRYNHADSHGACVALDQSSPLFINDSFVDNTSGENGGAINSTSVSNPTFINCTISGNSATNGGGLYCYLESDPTFKNTIIYGNTADWGSQVYLYNGDSDPDFYYCDLEGGIGAFFGNGAGGAYSGTVAETITSNPMFDGSGEHPYQLTGLSGCLNSADPDTSLTCLPPYDLAGNPRIYGNRVDIGAYEFQGEPIQMDADFVADVTAGPAPLTVQFTDASSGMPTLWSWDFNLDGTPDSNEQNPSWTYEEEGIFSVSLTISDGANLDTEIKFDFIVIEDVDAITVPIVDSQLFQNTPNPFNPDTCIRFSTVRQAPVELTIFNVAGQKVTTLAKGIVSAGNHEVIWHGTDDAHASVASGIYFYVLKVNQQVVDRKRAILLK